jgi:hypothetical protein
MTQIKVDNVVDAAGTAAADFTSGLTVAGAALSTLNAAEYYETGTEPTSPKNGAIWKDTANDKVMVYIAGEFKEVELGAGGGVADWTVDLSSVTYDSVYFDVNSYDGAMQGASFSTDGTKLFMSGASGDNVYQFSLSTAYDISTLSYDSVTLDVSAKEATSRDVFISSDGAELYVVGSSSDSVHQYSLSTANDLSTATFSNSFSVSSQTSNPYAIYITSDGTKMYIGEFSSKVHQYTLSTAFDISSASHDSALTVSQASVMGVFLNPSGTKLYWMSQSTDIVYQYTLSTAFDISTATADSSTFSLGSGDWADISFSLDGTKMYALNYAGTDKLHQYSTGL